MSAAEQGAIEAAEWALASATRGRLYGWFSALFAQEVSERLYRSQFAAGAFAPFAGLGGLGLAAELQRLEAASAALRAVELPRLELAADFAQLFLLDGKTSALPYASAYAGKDAAAPLYGAAEARMRDFLAARALAIQPGFREPADHLAVALAFMAELAGKEAGSADIAAAARGQAGFLRDALLDWLPRFVARCRQAAPRFDFYPALAALLIGFVRADLSFLDDLAGSGPAAATGAG